MLYGQTGNPAPTGYFTAKWILPPGVGGRDYGVYHFRKTMDLTAKPVRFVVHISADNRFRFFVNGREVGDGPARGDTQHWYFDSFDLAPYLKTGKNVLAVQVWNMGEHAPVAQWSYHTGLIIEGDGPQEQIVNTDASWQVIQNPAYQPVINDIPKLWTYIVVGPGDRVDAAKYLWDWEQPDYDDRAWPKATAFGFPAKRHGYGTDGNWALMPRSIPQMQHYPVSISKIRRTSGLVNVQQQPGGSQQYRIPAGQKTTILLDQMHLTNGYPELTVSGGRGATVRLSYAEGMMDEKRQKGHRDSINGRKLIGFEDEFVCDGGANRTFRPLWFRTWRYLQLDIETKDEPLTIEQLQSTFAGYPFEEKAKFSSSDPSLAAIWEVGWRTARLCAMETYMDCPYYEQLQYTGDTRIQALISLYVSGDDRLMRKAIQDFADSRIANGLTQSRYPCNDLQVIPTFSLFWISMIHDYWRHRTDDAFIKSQLGTVETVLQWHEDRLGPDGLNGRLEWWNFVDWAWAWNEESRIGGVPPGVGGGSSILSLQQVYTLRQAADLMTHFGKPDKAAHYRALAQRMADAVSAQCWDASRRLLADTPAKKIFSQHANIWGVLTDAIPAAQQRDVLQRIMPDTSLTQATFYFQFYLFEALQKTGMGDAFLPQLAPWRNMLAQGLTTFAENPEPVRSDCHAWSASPNYELLSLVCGIRPASPGFKTVRIEPFPGDLTFVEGSIPHPGGVVRTRFERKGNNLNGFVDLPVGVTGVLVWKGKEKALVSGLNRL